VFSLFKHCSERVGEAGDGQSGRFGARDDDGLFVRGGEDVFDEPFGHPRCLRTYRRNELPASGFADRGRVAELVRI
jgi:hypothetical protein